ncbi:uncharacterized protein LOC127281217 isoform X3 [Leptopilina boulardi]|uniref:uncharacterized protein LOC127281217 isoform X3 n=1 Tax=Leptopilina boulardi TaxID=63433 RepID=UPI0021F59DF4|nr:uncharacterized protein LOC127281217 isoform X3 [Leptopilina boulardi]
MFTCLWNFFDWLDQPVTSSSTGMDGKKLQNVQASSSPASGQVRIKGGGDGTSAISGVRRKSGPQGLRSPAAKRPLSAPVALQGWLHKQGSEGLMLWKRRWFVLSEYCLFYYKGPEEEKLLGSILLPSYRVTVCRPEDKVNKKFAFKAEHANMRTYHFAAETRENMNQWVNALTLASLLQDPNPRGDEASSPLDMAGPADGDRSARPSVSSISSILNQSADDSDSGFHGFQSRDDPSHTSNNNSSPNSVNTASFPNLNNNGNTNGNNNGPNDMQPQPMVNGWMQQSPQYGQPGTSQQYNQFPISHQLQSVQSHSQVLQSHSQVLQSQTLQTHQVLQSQVVHSQVLQSHSQILQPHNQTLQALQSNQNSQPQTVGVNANIVHTVQPMGRNYCQPVYANTPPKPKRFTEGGQNSTPSPDPDYRKSPVSPDIRMTSKSPMNEYDRNTTIYGTRVPAQQQQQQQQATQATLRTDKSGLNYGLNYNQERRTPDTYGRSAKPRSGGGGGGGSRGNGDYEDVYGAPQLYQRPAGPVGYTKAPAPAPIPIPVYAQQIQQQQVYGVSPQVAPVMRQPKVHPPPRPHSADFLEYEANRRPDQQTLIQSDSLQNQSRRPQRPKSSLDIVNPSDTPANDNYFYSEERYAAQMRQSAVYIHQTPQHQQQQRNQSLSRATTPSMTSNRDRDVESGIGTLSENSCSGIRRSRGDHMQHIISSQPLQRHNDLASNEALLRRSLRERSYEPATNREMLIHNESGTVPRRMPRDYDPSSGVTRTAGMTASHVTNHSSYGSPAACHTGPRRWNEQQFARSASARLPRTRHPAAVDHDDDDDDDYADRSSNHDSRDGERKIQQREESMKRLLEWKQRMLQSPLTRKPSGSTNRGTAQNELSNYYKQQALLDLAAHEASVAEARHSRRREETHRPHVRSKSSDGRRSATNVSRYNSYSSDDEELGDVRRKRTRRPSHTGRSPRNFGEDRSPTTTVVNNTHKSSVAGIVNPSTLCGIPPDAGYEEVNYLQGKSTTTKERNSTKKDNIMDSQHHHQHHHETPKKPSGILKTPSAYSNQAVTRNEDGKLSTLAGYIPGETWQTKNVQWKTKDDNEYWEMKKKLDNSTKYLKTDEEIVDTVNLVQSRIKSFELCSSPVRETLTMQEPLKISPPQAIEAHVSKLDSTRKPTTIKEFALTQESPINDDEVVNKKNKSVKDLLADFEKKSQQIRQQEDDDKRKEVKHRGVFSDTETLLYDTGSDLDQPEKSCEEDSHFQKFQIYKQNYQQDDKYHKDRDYLNEYQKNTDYRKFTDNSMNYQKIYEYSKKTEEENYQLESDYLNQNQEEKESKSDYLNKNDYQKQEENYGKLKVIEEKVDSYTGTIRRKPEDRKRRRKTSKVEDLETSGYTRLSMTESLVTHGDQFSDESENNTKEDTSPENHYLPMSPRKSILDPNIDDTTPTPKMMESLFATLDHEESSYVEMTQNGLGRSLLAPNIDGDYSTLETAHYEFVCVTDNKMEPVYMEVNQLAENEEKVKKCEKRESERSELPDILTALKSDSSDADDESSKDLDSIDAPRHPRFSLSDTFRPASYYLGASRTLIAELHDSSDSELVSPPPIPTSPPPMEDLEEEQNKQTGTNLSRKSTESTRDSRVSLESTGSDSTELKNPEEARHRQLKRRPVSDDVCEVLDSLDELESLGSRFDGASIDLDQYLEELQARDAFNVDLYAKDLSYNSIYGFNENMLVADKLQKTSCQDKMNLDQPFTYGTRGKTSSASSLPSMRVSDLPPSHQHSQSFTGDAHYENVLSFSPLRGSPAVTRSEVESPIYKSRPQQISPKPITLQNHSRSASQDSARYSLSPNQRSSSSQDSKTSPQIYLATADHAPYYYSDLQTGATTETQPRSLFHTSRLPQLNNQRGDTSINKRNDIGRMVNPIARQLPRQIQVDDIDEARRIAAELRKTTQFLAEDKVGLVDKRNFYEADTLRRVKSTDPLPDVTLPDVSTRNLYPHGLRDKSGSQQLEPEFPIVTTSHRRSRSLEGLLDDVGLQNLVEERNRANRILNETTTVERSANTNTRIETENIRSQQGTFEDPWEQDSLWRESLRRVSLRHARSLDNLETPPRPARTELKSRGKITRGAIYVNDSVISGTLDIDRSTRVKRRSNDNEQNQNLDQNANSSMGNNEDEEDDAYETLAMDRIGAGGYVWDSKNEAYRKPNTIEKHFLVEGNLPPSGSSVERTRTTTSFELDREKLRQWDLLSSACLLQEQQRTSMADSGRGLPINDRVSTGQDGKESSPTTMTTMTKTTIKSKRIPPDDRKKSDDDDDDDMQESSTRATASQSGSVIGRDPLPSRAVSTSQLPQKSLTQSPPTHVSTLPLLRNSGSSHRQQPLPVHQSTLQSTKQSEHGSLINSQILKAASSGDVRLNSTLESRISSPSGQSSQRLMSPASHLRVISPIDHRVSSPSDSERQLHSPSERSVTSPLRREVDRGGGDLRQIQRVRECIELLHKRNNINSRRSGRVKSTGNGNLVQVSAGELLGRTHEELVLLLIQLRRQSSTLCKAMENCHMEIEAQARLVELDTPSRLENLQKQEKLEKHLMDLEKEYEKGKPLENLVANMLKLGSLYNRSTANGSVSGSRHDLLQENTREYRDRLEFNQRVEEQRLLAQERRDWDRLSPDHGQLQAKVHQLFKTDRLLQEESATVHSLQQDKEILQKALESLRYKLQGNRNSPAEVEHYRLLERELSKVRMLLAHHSKKLEETVAENDRLEQDLVVLRQKLQPSRRYVGSMIRDSTGTTAAWEAELAQQHVSDLKRQRQELSNQIRQLKEQIRPQTSTTPQVHHSKKRAPCSWLETDLDSGITRDHGLNHSPSSPSSSSSPHGRQIESPPQYISQSSPPYKEPLSSYKENSYRYSPPRQNQQHSPQNHITALSPQLREQIQQHQLKQQLLKDQIQGKSSPIQNNIPLYVNTEARKEGNNKHYDSPTNNEAIHPPEYIPPPPPPPPNDDSLLINGNYGQDDNKFAGLIHGREKQEIKTVRIVKRESERRQRDRGDRTGGLGIPLTNGLAAPGGAKRLGEDEFGGSQHFEKAQLGKVVEESPISHAQSTVQLSEIDDVQFQRSMSLPRGFGGQRPHPAVHQAPVLPPPRSDSMNALKNMIARRHRVRFENQDGSSDSTLSPYTDSPSSSSYVPMSSPNYSTSPPYSPSQQNYQVQSIRSQQQQQPVQYYSQYGSTPSIRATESLGGILNSGPMSPTIIPSVHERLFGSAASLNGIGETSSPPPPQLSPVFKSEAAKQIIKEMTEKKIDTPKRRLVPKEKRRHYTVSSSKPIFDLEDTITKMGMGRARDDLDMERALRPRINAPDVVRSTLSQKELKYNESTIDQLLGTPNKIVIPERYIPEKTPELTAEEREQRLKKVESIRKMLSETVVTASEGGEDEKSPEKSGTLKQKVEEEKRQREHILQLNQILAKQVMEKSKMVAVKALATLPLDQNPRFDDDDLSPLTPLPLYQQRENFYS